MHACSVQAFLVRLRGTLTWYSITYDKDSFTKCLYLKLLSQTSIPIAFIMYTAPAPVGGRRHPHGKFWSPSWGPECWKNFILQYSMVPFIVMVYRQKGQQLKKGHHFFGSCVAPLYFDMPPIALNLAPVLYAYKFDSSEWPIQAVHRTEDDWSSWRGLSCPRIGTTPIYQEPSKTLGHCFKQR